MAREIYNLGRVTGLSAYELNVKHQMEEYPDIPSMTEKEWIAATITAGASLVLKIPAGTAAGAHDYPLPAESSLLSQSMEVETRRGGMIHVYSFIIDIANTGLSLLNEVDSFDMLDGGMDMEPISDMFTLFI